MPTKISTKLICRFVAGLSVVCLLGSEVSTAQVVITNNNKTQDSNLPSGKCTKNFQNLPVETGNGLVAIDAKHENSDLIQMVPEHYSYTKVIPGSNYSESDKRFEKGGLFYGFSPTDEILEQRADIHKYFLKGDDQRLNERRTSPRAIHYRDETGAWQDIVTDIGFNQDVNHNVLNKYAYSNKTNSYHTYLPDKPGNTGYLMIFGGQYHKKWVNPSAGIHYNGSFSQENLLLTQGEIQKNSIIYNNMFPGVLCSVTVESERVAMQYVFTQLPEWVAEAPEGSAVEFSETIVFPENWSVYRGGDKMISAFSAESFAIIDESSGNGYYIYPMVAKDASCSDLSFSNLNAVSGSGFIKAHYFVEFVPEGIRVHVRFDAEWMKQQQRTYPVTVCNVYNDLIAGGSTYWNQIIEKWDESKTIQYVLNGINPGEEMLEQFNLQGMSVFQLTSRLEVLKADALSIAAEVYQNNINLCMGTNAFDYFEVSVPAHIRFALSTPATRQLESSPKVANCPGSCSEWDGSFSVGVGSWGALYSSDLGSGPCRLPYNYHTNGYQYSYSCCDNGASASFDSDFTMYQESGCVSQWYVDGGCASYRAKYGPWSCPFTGYADLMIDDYYGESGSSYTFSFTAMYTASACTTPGTPTGLTASLGVTDGNFYWSAGSPAGSATVYYNYNIYDNSWNYITGGTTSGTSVYVSGLICNTGYYLEVQAYTTCNYSYSGWNSNYWFYTGACCTTPSNPSASGTTSICSGSSANISATSTNATTIYWYTGGCGSTQVGTSSPGANFSVSPTSTTTYYARGYNSSGGCWSSGCGTVTVTVAPTPTAPTSVTATPSTVCSGSSSYLNATSAGNTINWYTSSSGGTPIGSSASGVNYPVSPGSTTTYYAEAQTIGVISGSETFYYNGGIQTWTVPSGITSITIDAYGAQGGDGNAGTGGLGARMVGTFDVTSGQVLNILVGQKPASNGGGGGTFVVAPGNVPMIIAGGGGGGAGACCGTVHNGDVGQTTTYGSAGINASGGTGAGGTGGNGGGVGSNVQNGGAGGGFNSNGANGYDGATGGVAYLSGGAGGHSGQTPDQYGGYGGGGGGYNLGWTYGAGGGGGGYSGGGSTGGGSQWGGGGGGGSYNNGSNASNIAGYQTGNGQVIISWPVSAGCPSATRTPVTVTVVDPATISGGAISASPSNSCEGASVTVTNNTWNGGTTGGTIYYWASTEGGYPCNWDVYSGYSGGNSFTLTSYPANPNTSGCEGDPYRIYIYSAIYNNTCGYYDWSSGRGTAIWVYPDPTITGQPVGGTICAGSSHTLSVTATGGTPGSLSYQWYRNGSSISGATNASFAATLAGNYYCVVSSSGSGCTSPITSSTVTLTVNANAGITSATAAVSPICSTATTTVTANGVVGANAILTWWTGPGGTGTNLGSNNSITVGPGTYYARVTATCGSAVEASVTVAAYAPLTPGVVGSDQTICYNTSPAAFTVVTAPSGGDGSFAYQWQSSVGSTGTWTNISGATSATYDDPNNITQTACYRRMVSNTCGTAFSDPVTPTSGLVLKYTFDDQQEPSANIAGSITADWNSWGGHAGSSTYFNAPNGNQGVYLHSTSSGVGGVNWYNTGGQKSCTPNTVYTVSAIIKFSGGNPSANLFYLRQYNSGGSQITEYGLFNPSNMVDLGGEWYKAYATFTTTATSTTFLIQGYEYDIREVWIYDVMLEQKDHFTPYTPSSRQTVSVTDYSGNGNSGTIAMATSPTWTSNGVNGGDYKFDGASKYINVGNPASMQITGSQTISMWLKPAVLNDGVRRNPYAKAYGGEGTITQEPNGTINYYYGQGGGNTSPYQGFTMTNTITVNQWVHIAVVRDLSNNQLYWYKNGVLTNQTAALYNPAVASALSTTIGLGYAGSYNGEIDDVKVYNVALSPTDIASLYNSTAGLHVTVQSQLTAGAITADQTICSGGDPDVFSSTQPGTGSGTITYKWESSVSPFSSWTVISGASSATYDAPSGLTATTKYRRTAISTLNGIACESSPTTAVTATVVADPSVTVTGPAAVCAPGSASLSAAISNGTGTFSYQWQYHDGTSWVNVGSNSPNYTTATLTQNTDFRCLVSSTGTGCDLATSNTFTVNMSYPSATAPTAMAAGDFAWSGNSSSAWETAANWFVYSGSTFSVASTAPQSTNNVFIRGYGSCASNNPTINSSVSVNNLTIESGKTLTIAGSNVLTIYGNYSNAGTFVKNTSTVVLAGGDANIASGGVTVGTHDFYNLELNATGIKTVLTNEIRVSNNYVMTSGTLNMGTTLILNVYGQTITLNGGTISGTKTSQQLYIQGTNDKTINGTGANVFVYVRTGNCNLTIASGCVMNMNNNFHWYGITKTAAINGQIAAASNGTFYVRGSNCILSSTNPGICLRNLDFYTTGNFTVSSSISISGYLRNFSTGVMILGSPEVNVGTNFTNNNAAGIVDINNCTLRIKGNYTNTGTIIPVLSTVEFNGTGPQTINSGGVGASKAFYDVVINKPSGTATFSTNSIEILNDFSILSGTCAISGSLSMFLHGDWTHTAGVFTCNTSTVSFDDFQSDILSTSASTRAFYHVIVNSPVFMNDSIDINGDITINPGHSLTTNNFNITVARSWTNNGTFTPGTGTVTFDGSATPVAINTGGTGAGKSFYNLTVNKGAAAQVVNIATNDIDVNNNLAFTRGRVNGNNRDIYLARNYTCNTSNGTFYPGAGTLILDGSGDQTINSGGVGAGKAINNLLVNKSGGTASISSYSLDVDGNVDINAGTLAVSGSLGMIVAGNWNHTGGSFTCNTSTVTFDGAASAITSTSPGIKTFCNVIVADNSILGSDIDIDGNITINNACSLDAGAFSMSVARDWINNGSFSAGSGSTVTFDGMVSAQITGSSSTTFFRMALNKGTALTLDLAIICPVTISNASTTALTLTNGLLRINSGGILNLPNAAQTITATSGIEVTDGIINGGNATLNNDGFFRLNSGTVNIGTAAGNSWQNRSNSVFVVSGGTMNVAGRLMFTAANTLASITGGTINLCTVGNTATTGSFNMVATAGITISGNPVINFVNPNTNASPVDLNILSGSGVKSIEGGTFRFGTAATPATAVFRVNSAVPVYDVAISGVNNPTLILLADLQGSRNLTIDAGGTLSANNHNWNLSGTWDNKGSYIPGIGKVMFNGATPQSIYAGGSSFNGVIFNNTSPGSADIAIYEPMIINGDADFENGVAYFSGTGSMSFGSAATSNSGSVSSYVDGPVAKQGTSAFTFATGEGNIWAPVGIAAPGVNSTITAEYNFVPGPLNWTAAYMCDESQMHHTSGVEHWELTTTASTPAVTIFWFDAARSGITSLSDLAVAHWSGDCWEYMGGTVAGSLAQGSITSTLAFSSYSPVSFGSKNNINPLPVELVSFTGDCSGKGVELQWQTATETNNHYFVLERSADAVVYDTIASIEGAGNSTTPITYNYIDRAPVNGIGYYRLKQVDIDGTGKYYNAISVVCEGIGTETTSLSVYPNPFRDEFVLKGQGCDDGSALIRVCDALGKEYMVIDCPVENGALHAVFDGSSLPPAVYFVHVKTAESSRTLKIVKH